MSQEPNTLYPGRANYVGPTSGIFGLLHHDRLYEASHDVRERVAYIRHSKPKSEVAIRLHNMIYLGAGAEKAEAKRATLYADYDAKRAPLDADYKAKRAPLYADYEAKRDTLDAETLAYIRHHIPDCAWDGKALVFAEAA